VVELEFIYLFPTLVVKDPDVRMEVEWKSGRMHRALHFMVVKSADRLQRNHSLWNCYPPKMGQISK